MTATIATDVSLLASLLAWQWVERQPFATAPWKLPTAPTRPGATVAVRTAIGPPMQ